jgi:serine/threonine protein kinase
MLVGEPPFHANSEAEIYRKILRGVWSIPETEDALSAECVDVLRGLLTCDPGKRLGANGSGEVLGHPWFAGLDPSNLPAPFMPELENREDTTYFHSRYSFSDAGDADIEEDIRRAQAQGLRPQIRTSRRGSLVSREKIIAMQSAGPSDDDGFGSFPSVSLENLEGANRAALQRVMAFDKTPTPWRSFGSLADFEDRRARPRAQMRERAFTQSESRLAPDADDQAQATEL